jgi:hypothetical protein
MTLKLKRTCEKHGTRISLSGELRYPDLVEVYAEIEKAGRPTTLDLDEVEVVDIDGIRLLNECKDRGIQVVNCTPYIREWMLQETRNRQGEPG